LRNQVGFFHCWEQPTHLRPKRRHNPIITIKLIRMAEVSLATKQKIDSMSKEELLLEKNKGNASIFQQEKFSYLLTRLAIVQSQEDEQHQEETLNVAKKANTIAEQALATSNQSKKFAVWAIFISLIALVIQILLSK